MRSSRYSEQRVLRVAIGTKIAAPKTSVVNSLCYQYLYDRRNRVIGKKVADKGWEYIIYDKLDRPVLTHNAKLGNGEWLFTKYDKLGRVAYTGLWTDPQQLGRYDLQLQVDEYSLVTSESRSSTALFITQGTGVNYTSQMFPMANLDIYSVNYYDDYDFSHPGVTVPVATSYGDVLSTPADARSLKGLPTGSVVRTLNTNTWTYTLTGYDAKGRNVWSGQRNNYLAYSQNSHSKLDFTGKVTASLTEHTKDAQATREVRDFYTYDNQGRLLRQTQKIGQQAEQLIAYNHYDALGQLDEKKVGRANPAAAYAAVSELQKVQYGYNMRGWLTKVNNMQGTGLFAFEIAYDQPQTGMALYNGNIAQTKWKTSDNLARGYTYGYDALNRLTMAGYFGGAAQEIYTEGPIAYDKNGNIQSLTRYGLRTAQQDIAKIDGLSYTYQQYSNRLLKVTDDTLVPDGFNNGASADATDYAYDANGNMTSDLNKGIGNIRYNHLNLPRLVSFTAGNTIEYLYDANGNKLRKRVTVTSNGTATTTTTDYAGGFVYLNGVLQHFANAEGYAAYNAGTNTFSYIYQYKDHLGNSRVSYTQSANGNAQVVEENSYYAFGLQHKGYGATLTWLGNAHAEKYKYNGKELQDELGLNMYDYGARNYDPAIGRWMNVDPLAEDYEDYTPYQFASNQPVHAQEVEGLENDNDLNKRLQLREGRRIVSDATRVSSAVFKGFAASNSTNRYTTAYKGLHKGDTKAAIVDKSKGRIGADGKPTGKPVLRFDKADAKTKYAHINVEGVLDHAPIPGGNSSLKVISKLGDGVNAFNKVAVPVALTLDAVRIGDAINQDGGIGRNTVETTAKVGGSWAGAWGGSILGAEAGAIVGGFTGPFAEVASPVLGLIGGIAGGIGGAIGGEAAVEHTIENFGKSKPGMKLPGDL